MIVQLSHEYSERERNTERERLERKGSRDAYLRPVSPSVAWEGSASAATGDEEPRTAPSFINGSARLTCREATARSRGAAGAKP